MSFRVVRLGSEREKGEGLRIGTVRRPPRGVPRVDFARRNFYDVWLPELAPSAPTVSWAVRTEWSAARWRVFRQRYLAEMRRSEARHLIELLAAMSHTADFSIGCYCEDESHCHRTLLRELLIEAGASEVRFVH